MSAKWKSLGDRWLLEAEDKTVMAIVIKNMNGSYNWTIYAPVTCQVASRTKEYAQGIVEALLNGSLEEVP